MRKTKLLSTVAMALLLGTGAASAQGMGKEPPERAPAAQQSAPAEKVAPSMKAGEQKSPQTTDQAAPESKAPGKGHETTGQSPKSQTSDKPGAIDKDKSSAPSGKSDIRSNSSRMARRRSPIRRSRTAQPRPAKALLRARPSYQPSSARRSLRSSSSVKSNRPS